MYKRLLRLLLLTSAFAISASYARAQQGVAVSVRNGTANPGACTERGLNIFYNRTTDLLQYCDDGVWTGVTSVAAGDARWLKLAADNDPLTGALTGVAGTAALPSFSFTGETDTGMYLFGVNSIGFPVGGVDKWVMSSSGGLNCATDGGCDIGNGAADPRDLSLRRNLILRGATSGSVTLAAAAVAGTNTVTLPAGTTDFSATGGADFVLKQESAGSAITVAQLAAADLSNGVTGTGSVVLADSPTLTTIVGLPDGTAANPALVPSARTTDGFSFAAAAFRYSLAGAARWIFTTSSADLVSTTTTANMTGGSSFSCATAPCSVVAEIAGRRTADGALGTLQFTNTDIVAADKRSVLITANRLGADNTGQFQVTINNAGSFVTGQTIEADGTIRSRSPVTTISGSTAASVSLTAQTASVGATNIVASAAAGLYRVCWVQQITTAATTSSSLQTTIAWNNGSAKSSTYWEDYAAGTAGTAADESNTLNSERGKCLVIRTASSTTITYATTYASSGATAMQYAFRITAERLQ